MFQKHDAVVERGAELDNGSIVLPWRSSFVEIQITKNILIQKRCLKFFAELNADKAVHGFLRQITIVVPNEMIAFPIVINSIRAAFFVTKIKIKSIDFFLIKTVERLVLNLIVSGGIAT